MTRQRLSPAAGDVTTGDGTRLRVVEDGDPDAAVTVVLVHGWMLSKHTWDRVVAKLPDAVGSRVRVVRYDLRGHGESDAAPAGTATIDRCADDLADVIGERVPDGPLVLAGHSMGGMTLMALAERHPDLVAERVRAIGLVATSSGGLFSPGLGLPDAVAAAFNAGERRVRTALARSRDRRVCTRSAWMRPGLRWLLFGTDADKDDVAISAGWVADCHPPSMAGFRESLAEHERVEALAAFRSLPVVVLAGLADRLCPLPHARRVAEALPDARLLVYAGAGHMLPMERADEVTGRLADVVRAAARGTA